MDTPLHDLVTRIFAAVEAKNVDLLMTFFADDAVLIDPHFPNPLMRGKPTIAAAMRRAIPEMRSFGYTALNYFETEDGQHAAVETHTHHVLKKGKMLDFPQVFIFDMAAEHITRMQAYEPYGPHGIFGAFLFLGRIKRRLTRGRHAS